MLCGTFFYLFPFIFLHLLDYEANVHPNKIVIGDDEPEINANNSEDIRTIIDAEVNADKIHIKQYGLVLNETLPPITEVNPAKMDC